MESKKSLIIPTVEGNGQTASVWITSSGSFGLSNFDVRDAATGAIEAHAGQDGMTCILVRQVSQAN
jgi:hypothetical protein